MTENIIKVSKIEAARRQLKTAIKLFFYNGDKVSIHTLACASHGILSDIGKSQKIKSFNETFLEKVKPEKRKEVRAKLNKAKNFLKHADNDPDKILQYNPESTDFWIFDCCVLYSVLAGETTDVMKVFMSWFYIKNPRALVDGDLQLLAENLKGSWKSATEFFEYSLPIIAKQF